MTKLGEVIRAEISASGPISVERYMALALSHPEHGYYNAQAPFGAQGDFITAPDISQMFGELVGLWSAEAWISMGAPDRLRLVELGPGRGTLMQDALRAARVSQQFYASLDIHMVETSAVLERQQRAALASTGLPFTWHRHLHDVPDGPAIIIANELFDALPVRHYVRAANGWHERCVGLGAGGELAFGLSPLVEAAISVRAAEGAILEIGAQGHQLMGVLAGRLAHQGGAALIIDYGHAATCLGETLQAMRQHRAVDPLAEPGLADLTAHVDFAGLARAALAAGALVQGPVGQGMFLAELGIFERAAALRQRATPQQAAAIGTGLLRLTQGGAGMGELFKVLAVRHPSCPQLPGFSTFSGA